MTELTVLSAQVDPYRLDTPANHRNAEWFADVATRLVPHGKVHLRGLHYRIVAAANVLLPDGKPYTNFEDAWEFLADKAAKAARWLNYLDCSRIVDERNAPPQIFVPAHEPPSIEMDVAFGAMIPSLSEALPHFFITGFIERQPYRIILIGEKSSLGPVLQPIAQQIGGELLLPTGEASDTMIAELAARAASDGRPAVVLYFSDFDPSGWQMPVSVARKLQALRDQLYP